MALGSGYELATDAQFREVSNFTTPPRAGRVTAVEVSGQVRVETDDPDGGDVLAWPLNGFSYAVDDVVYVIFAVNSPDSAIVIGGLAPAPTLDGYVPLDGSVALTADWDIGEDRRIKAEGIRARDDEGLRLEDDAGNLGIYVEDGGFIGFGGVTNPTHPFHFGGDNSGIQMLLYPVGAGSDIRAMFRLVPKGSPTAAAGRATIQLYNTDFIADSSNYEFGQFGFLSETFEVFTRGIGTGTTRPIHMWTYNNPNQLYLAANGRNGMGTASPQGKLHIHDGTGGWLFVTKTGITGTPVELIPNAAGDVVSHVGIFGVVTNSAGDKNGLAIYCTNGGTVDNTPSGGNTIRFSVNANGQMTVVRQAGSATWEIAVLLVWK